MKYKAFGKNIIFKKVENPEKSKSFIILSSKLTEEKAIFKIVDVGNDILDIAASEYVFKENEHIALVGDYVILREFQYSILDVEMNLVIGEKDTILALVEFEDERN